MRKQNTFGKLIYYLDLYFDSDSEKALKMMRQMKQSLRKTETAKAKEQVIYFMKVLISIILRLWYYPSQKLLFELCILGHGISSLIRCLVSYFTLH